MMNQMERNGSLFRRFISWDSQPLLRWGGAVLLAASCACAGSSYQRTGDGTYFGRKNGDVWVLGPWPAIRSSLEVDEVVDQLCPAIMELEGARAKNFGQEYCGAIYSLRDGTYYASYPSPLGRTTILFEDKRKSCHAPRYVKDSRGYASVLSDYHSHPWFPSPMSPEDRSTKHQRWSIRVQFDAGCRVMKLIPYAEDPNRPGEVYLRRGKTWVLIGRVMPEDKPYGYITPVDED
jgi:hypothetical protein